MIVIEVDVHKRTHALAAVDAATGQLLRQQEVEARENGHLEALRWSVDLGDELVGRSRTAAISPTILSRR